MRVGVCAVACSFRDAKRHAVTAAETLAAMLVDREVPVAPASMQTITFPHRAVVFPNEMQMKMLLRTIPLRRICATAFRQRRFLFVF